MKFTPFLLWFLMSSAFLAGQHTYTTNAKFVSVKKEIDVYQKMVFFNHSKVSIDKIYIYDWNNAYDGSGSPLSNKLSDDYNFSFEKSSSVDKGKTHILHFTVNGQKLDWNRLPNQPDIIELSLPNGVPSGDTIDIYTDYHLKLPSDRFTGYGISSKNELALNNWQLLFAFLHSDGSWTLDSNLGFDDISLQPADHQLLLSYPKNMQLAVSVSGNVSKNIDRIKWSGGGKNIKKISFDLDFQTKYDTLSVDGLELVTDLANKSAHLQETNVSVEQLIEFAKSYFPIGHNNYLLLQSKAYESHPIVGIDLLYNTLKPLPQQQILTLKMAKTLIYDLVYEHTLTTYRNQPWLVDGLAQYLFMRYIDMHQSDLKLIGNLDDIIGFRNYEFSNATFNDRFALLAGFATRQNVTQPLNTPNDKLSKYNRKIANPARVALGLRLLQKHEGDALVDRSIQSYFFKNFSEFKPENSFENIVLHETDGQASWFFKGYLPETELPDYVLKAKKENKNETLYQITNQNKSEAPILLALYKGDSLVHKMWMSGGVYTQNLRLEDRFANRAVINPDQDIVEINFNNNNFTSTHQGTRKKTKISLFEDIPTSHARQWFVVPSISFNAYDGILAGAMLNNGLAMKHPLFFSLSPQYSTKGNNLNGSANVSYKQLYQNRPLSQVQYGLSFESYHYASNLRYYRFSPSVNWFFRPYGLNDNRRSSVGLRYITLHRENDVEKSRLPGYDLGALSYFKSNFSSAKTQSLFTELQIGDAFSKLTLSYTYRSFYKEAKQFYFRVFGGVFLYNNDKNFYNFGVSRVNDYAFNYNLFGRSENSGFYSQQFVMAEGGFKSFIDVPRADSWMLATNLSTTLWRSLEAYADFGLVKNSHQPTTFIYDSGFGINIIQNYFQLYFPVYSNLGWEIDDHHYASKIRFTLAANPEELFSLFTRSWF